MGFLKIDELIDNEVFKLPSSKAGKREIGKKIKKK